MNGFSARILVVCTLLGMVGTVLPVHAQQSSYRDWRRYEGDTDPAEEQRRIYDWRRSSGAVRAQIDALGTMPITNLPIPILFGVELSDIIQNFGDPRGGGTRTHEGLDMLAPKRTPIISPTDAVVLRTGTGANSGHHVYTANPGGETFVYMHLDQQVGHITAGNVLKAGDLIGFVGNTGNAVGAPNHLHFEIRQGEATDPYPRLTKEFTRAEKMEIVGRILAQSGDVAALAWFLTDTYAGEFTQARTLGLSVPVEITTAISQVMAVPPDNDLELGDRGIAVTALQKLLIAANTGSAARELIAAGATGYFGPITQRALAEYQRSADIMSSSGYYGPITRAHLRTIPVDVASPGSSSTIIAGIARSIPAVDLDRGSRGAGVEWLQTYLITLDTGSTAGALAAVGATGYFGTLTQAALAEYQRGTGITPAIGYYGRITRAHLAVILE